MHVIKTLTSALAAAGLVGAIGLAYAQTTAGQQGPATTETTTAPAPSTSTTTTTTTTSEPLAAPMATTPSTSVAPSDSTSLPSDSTSLPAQQDRN